MRPARCTHAQPHHDREPDSRQGILVGELRRKSREKLRAMTRLELEMLKQLDAKERGMRGIEVWEREGKVPALTETTQSTEEQESSPSEEELP